jgi:ribosomal protein L17
MAKVFKVKVTKSGMTTSRETIYEGTIDRLVNGVFGYTLDCGASWNRKINSNPKTIGALIKALNASYDEIEGGYTRSWAEEVK